MTAAQLKKKSITPTPTGMKKENDGRKKGDIDEW